MTRKSTSAPPTLDLSAMQRHACDASALLKAMGNEQRLLILCQLVQGDLSVGELGARIKLSQSALSQHLAVLRESGIVSAERQAQNVRYSLPKGVVPRLIAVLRDEYCS